MSIQKFSIHNGFAGSNKIFARINKRYIFTTLDELFSISKHSDISVPTIDSKGKQNWIKIQKISFQGKRKTLKIIPTNGLSITAVQKQNFPVISSVKEKKTDKGFRLRFKQINDFKKYDQLWFVTHFITDLEKGSLVDYTKGFFIGFFLAEGNYIYYKHKIKENSVYSRSALKRWSRKYNYTSVKTI